MKLVGLQLIVRVTVAESPAPSEDEPEAVNDPDDPEPLPLPEPYPEPVPVPEPPDEPGLRAAPTPLPTLDDEKAGVASEETSSEAARAFVDAANASSVEAGASVMGLTDSEETIPGREVSYEAGEGVAGRFRLVSTDEGVVIAARSSVKFAGDAWTSGRSASKTFGSANAGGVIPKGSTVC